MEGLETGSTCFGRHAGYGEVPKHEEFDLVGVGFGPSNLALAVAVMEHNQRAGRCDIRAAFLERQPRFGWHLGMMIEGATMQVSFLKDLATMRNPTSSLTFVNYLHERGRLADFINQKDFFPTRYEFHDYLEWAAGQVPTLVAYDREVTGIRPVRDSAGTVVFFDVESRYTSTRMGTEPLRARNVVIATGLTPRLPPGVALSDRVWHSSQLMSNVGDLVDSPPRSVAVVGSGQSAAEVAAYFHETFETAKVYCLMHRYGYSPSDDSPFANRVFNPAAIDDFYTSSTEARERTIAYHANTNYSVVDEKLITDLYKKVYRESVIGASRLVMLPLRQVRGIIEGVDGRPTLDVAYLPTATQELFEVDLAVLATGYDHMDPSGFLREFEHECLRDTAGRLQVSRFYSVVTTDTIRAGIYLQGGIEHTHGLSASLLSNVAVRAGEILDSISADVTSQRMGA